MNPNSGLTLGRNTPRYDWQAIELEYRAGVIPLPGICQRHGVSMARLVSVARANGWERAEPPTSAEIYGIAATGFLPVDPNSPFSAEDVKKAAIMTMVSVIECHRSDIGRMRGLLSTYIERLEQVMHPVDDISGPSLGARESIADGMVKASKIMTSLIQLERQAYGLEAFNPDDAGKQIEGDAALVEVRKVLDRLDEFAKTKAAEAGPSKSPSGRPILAVSNEDKKP